MWWVLVSLVAQAGAPAGVDLNDLDHWETEAERFLDGPPGCWEVVGHASWAWDAGRFGMSKGDQVFAATMVDGLWGPFHVEPMGEKVRERRSRQENVIYAYDTRWAPLFGTVDELEVSNDPKNREKLPIDQQPSSDPRAEAREARARERREARRDRQREKDGRDDGPANVLREALDNLTGSSAVSSWTQWDDATESVVLTRGLPIEGSGQEAEQSIRFPAAGPPTEMDIAFPESWYAGTIPRYRVSNAEVHLRVRPSGGKLFPTAESFKLEFGIFGFTVTGAQTIRYTSIRPCASPVSSPEVPDAEPPG